MPVSSESERRRNPLTCHSSGMCADLIDDSAHFPLATRVVSSATDGPVFLCGFTLFSAHVGVQLQSDSVIASLYLSYPGIWPAVPNTSFTTKSILL